MNQSNPTRQQQIELGRQLIQDAINSGQPRNHINNLVQFFNITYGSEYFEPLDTEESVDSVESDSIEVTSIQDMLVQAIEEEKKQPNEQEEEKKQPVDQEEEKKQPIQQEEAKIPARKFDIETGFNGLRKRAMGDRETFSTKEHIFGQSEESDSDDDIEPARVRVCFEVSLDDQSEFIPFRSIVNTRFIKGSPEEFDQWVGTSIMRTHDDNYITRLAKFYTKDSEGAVIDCPFNERILFAKLGGPVAQAYFSKDDSAQLFLSPHPFPRLPMDALTFQAFRMNLQEIVRAYSGIFQLDCYLQSGMIERIKDALAGAMHADESEEEEPQIPDRYQRIFAKEYHLSDQIHTFFISVIYSKIGLFMRANSGFIPDDVIDILVAGLLNIVLEELHHYEGREVKKITTFIQQTFLNGSASLMCQRTRASVITNQMDIFEDYIEDFPLGVTVPGRFLRRISIGDIEDLLPIVDDHILRVRTAFNFSHILAIMAQGMSYQGGLDMSEETYVDAAVDAINKFRLLDITGRTNCQGRTAYQIIGLQTIRLAVESDGDCTICWTRLNVGEVLVQPVCPGGLHRFHEACLMRAVVNSQTCPLCRHDL